MRPSLPASLLLAGLAATPALAQDRPPALTPTRDVTILYRISGAGEGQTLRMRHAAAQGLMRTELPGGLGWGVIDLQKGGGFMVVEAMRAVVPIAAGQGPQGVVSPSARYRRGATARIAGLDCTIWSIEDQGRTGEVCLTGDGVMLRGRGAASGQEGAVEAIEVRFGPQDPAQFRRPEGYREMTTPPGMPPGMGRTPPR
jgi:hypothetical protein